MRVKRSDIKYQKCGGLIDDQYSFSGNKTVFVNFVFFSAVFAIFPVLLSQQMEILYRLIEVQSGGSAGKRLVPRITMIVVKTTMEIRLPFGVY